MNYCEVQTLALASVDTTTAVMVERRSRFMLLEKLLRKTSLNFSNAIHSCLIDYPRHLRRTITYNNGSENVDHGICKRTSFNQVIFLQPVLQLGKRLSWELYLSCKALLAQEDRFC
ncbi:MAG: hypothetical protein GY777_23565 [Candidatus Brocadiaceae bacterium]|nr:hypothetical protein [Candidatus Brocadiaceae bacterium]